MLIPVRRVDWPRFQHSSRSISFLFYVPYQKSYDLLEWVEFGLLSRIFGGLIDDSGDDETLFAFFVLHFLVVQHHITAECG
jgi:hypothetical protein